MAKKRKTEGLDDILKGKADEFESGRERQIDSELDDLVWELGHYEDREPLDSEAAEFRPEGRFEEIPPEELLTEMELEDGSLVEKPESLNQTDQTDLLRIELSGTDLELACGEVPIRLKEKVLEHCSRKNISPADIWYDEKAMKKVWRSWIPWHNIDNIFHDIGLTGHDAIELNMAVWVNYERLEDFDIAAVKYKVDKLSVPVAGKGRIPVIAGVLCEGRYSFELDISEGFDPGRLELNFIDLSDLGVPDPLLTEVLYDGISMYFEHEDFTAREMLDVRFLERGREADQGS